MEGDMEMHPDFIAPCGMYCGVCAVMYATRDDNLRFKERLVGVYKGKLPGSEHLSVDDIRCRGCLSEEPFLYCNACAIKNCTKNKGYTGCHECDAFPCEWIDGFPIQVGKKVILRAIPHWRAVGTEKFVQDEEARYVCPGCGHKLFRGVKRCNRCGLEVDLD
jgi:hypothetical protein